MVVYVVSKSGNKNFALDPDNIVEVCFSGSYPLSDAKSYALDHTKATDQPTWIYEVDLKARGTYKIEKQVIFAPAQ